MKKLYPLLFAVLFSLFANAQEEQEPPADVNMPVMRTQGSRVYGKVVDTRTKKGLEAASVQLYALRGGVDSLLGGMLTKANGDFSLTGVAMADSLRLVITAVGFKQMEKTVAAPANAEQPGFGNNALELDMGNITVEPDVQTLGGVTVVAQRPALEMGIDRRIFNADRSITSTGGTAIDVLRNVPSVTVDVEGNVSVRNTAPQIFVDGLPTILTLDQIPADNIERVEVITNPSARFDAASSGGIINIVLKKNKRVGLNGIISAGAGYPDVWNGNINLNARKGKFNVFAIGSYFQAGGRAKSETSRQNKENGITTDYFDQLSWNDRLRRFKSLRFGADFFLDNRNTFSLTQNIVDGRFFNDQEQRQEFFTSSRVLERYGQRFSDSRGGFNRYNTQFTYQHKFPEQGKELTANINYNFGDGNDRTNIQNTFFLPDGSEYEAPALVRNRGENNNNQATFQLDFSDPQGDNARFETGIRSYINQQQSIFNSFSVSNGVETKLPLSNNYKYREVVNAFYITYTNKLRSIGYQAGLRFEHSQFTGELVDSAQKFGYTYPAKFSNLFDALFPSLFLSRPVGENIELQLNYTRRIRRPNFWNLNPFIDINDPLNLSQGNPQLRPEYTNSFEFNYSQQYKSGNFLGSVYYRNNQGDITRYSDTITAEQFQQLNNAAVSANAILNTFINAQYTNRMGAEFTLQHKIGSSFDLTPTVNFQYRKVKADVGDLNLNNEGFNWEGKLIVNYRLPAKSKTSFFSNFSLQAVGEYESPEVIPQGRQKEQFSADFALRKDFLKDKKATFTFSVNDVFNTLRFGSILETDAFYQDSYSRRNVRNFRATLTYRFGKADFNLLNRRGNNRNGEGDDD